MPESVFNKVVGLKKRLWQRCFPVNYAKRLRAPFYVTLPDYTSVPNPNSVKTSIISLVQNYVGVSNLLRVNIHSKVDLK